MVLNNKKKQVDNLHLMDAKDMLKGLRLAVIVANKRLNNSKLLLKSDFPYDAFILYSFSYEEFGKALLIKDQIDKQEKGLPTWLFKGYSSHMKKMQRAKSDLPLKCSHFSPSIKLSNPNKNAETARYKVWRDKQVEEGIISRPAYQTGTFEDITNISSVSTYFDELTRQEFLYVNWDPTFKEWHSNVDYSINELEEAIVLLQDRLLVFAKQNNLEL